MLLHRTLLVLVITWLGCSPPSTKPTAADTAENQTTLKKLSGYLGCLEDHSGRVFQIADLYTERLGAGAPTLETHVQLQPANNPKKCLEALTQGKLLVPPLPKLEAAGDAYGNALRTVYALTTEGHGYHDRSDPKTYDPAKGIALHPRLVAAFAEFDRAQAALFDQVYSLNRTIRTAVLTRREAKEGRTIAVIADHVMYQAEGLVRFGATRWDQLDQLDVAGMVKSLGELEDAADELSAYALAHPKEADTSIKGLWILQADIKAYQIAARQLIVRARDKVAYTDSEKIMIGANNESAVVGTPAAMISAYNHLLEVFLFRAAS